MKKTTRAKNNSENIFLLLLVVGVVAVSGCISGGSSNNVGGNGISITDFASSVSEATDCDKAVRLNLDIENRGGKSVPSGEILACLSGKNFPGKTSEQMWAADSTTSVCQSLKKKLDAPDTVKNIPGGSASFKWTVNSPFVPFPLTRTDGFSGRVFYKYASRTSATVFVISESELAVSKQTGKSLPSAPEIDKTASPVDISVDVAQPVVGNSDDTFTLKVTLSNVGGGTVFDPSAVSFGSDSSRMPSIPEDKLNLITIKVDTSLGAGTDAESGFCNADLKNVELRKGSTVTIPCDIKIKELITSLKSFPILLTASYGYFVDSGEVPMAISGKKDKLATSCNKGTSLSGTTELKVTCIASPLSIAAGGSTTWTATATGGSGTYSYSWADTDGTTSTGAVSSWTKTYSTAGTRGASVNAASTDGQTASASCGSVIVT